MKTKTLFQKLLPGYTLCALVLIALSNTVAYYLPRVLNQWRGATYIDMTTAFDRVTPVLSSFSVIYFLAYPFWYITYYLVCRSDRERCYRLAVADISVKLLCGVIFLVLPTTNVRPAIENTGFCNQLLNFIYSIDLADNLFPSIHCLESWICFCCVRKEEKVPKTVKALSLLMALLVCASTLFTKQHVIADVVVGVLLAETAWDLSSSLFQPKATAAKVLRRYSKHPVYRTHLTTQRNEL